MKQLLKTFRDEEFGNAIIDWTVLMVGMVLMAIAVTTTIATNVDMIADDTTEHMETMNPSL